MSSALGLSFRSLGSGLLLLTSGSCVGGLDGTGVTAVDFGAVCYVVGPASASGLGADSIGSLGVLGGAGVDLLESVVVSGNPCLVDVAS